MGQLYEIERILNNYKQHNMNMDETIIVSSLIDKFGECVFLGYAENSKAYRFLVIESNDSYSVNTVIESRDAIFQEDRRKQLLIPRILFILMFRT